MDALLVSVFVIYTMLYYITTTLKGVYYNE